MTRQQLDTIESSIAAAEASSLAAYQASLAAWGSAFYPSALAAAKAADEALNRLRAIYSRARRAYLMGAA